MQFAIAIRVIEFLRIVNSLERFELGFQFMLVESKSSEILHSSVVYPVVLCGGAGTRLWPASRRNQPKQFGLSVDGMSLFQRAVQLVSTDAFAAPTVVTGPDLRFRVLEQLAAIDAAPTGILVEPEPRNTAPAVLAAALFLQDSDPDAMILVLPSDHRIADHDQFRNVVMAAKPAAAAGKIVTFGIRPTRPETGFGYLELASAQAIAADCPQPLRRFVEKPEATLAAAMLANGCYLWNAGIFLMSARTIVAAFRRLAPDLYDAVGAAVAERRTDYWFSHLDKRGWQQAASISVDYAIMERADGLMVMPYEGHWSDLGDWASVWRDGDQDEAGNVCSGDALAFDCRNSLLHCQVPDKLLVGLDLADMIAVATPDAVLVAPRSSSQKVGKMVHRLRSLERVEASDSRHDRRPWGWYDLIAVRDGFQVKHIMVEAGHAMSLQSHRHRAEHWIMLSGRAKVTVGERVTEVQPGDHVFIPAGSVHRLENVEQQPVVLVEVQVGDYLGEDDIVRYSDHYARADKV